MYKTLGEIRDDYTEYKVCPDCEMINLISNTQCIACKDNISNIKHEDNIVFNRIDALISELGIDAEILIEEDINVKKVRIL